MSKKTNKTNKINYWIIFLVVLLIVGFVLSRTRRASKRAIYRHPATEQPVEDTRNKNDTTGKMMTQEIPSIDKDVLLGKVNPSRDEDMVRVESRYASREGMFMHKEAYEAFLEMHKAASDDGVNLVIISAMRNFDHQKRIWDNKWNGRQVLAGNIRAADIDDPVERAKEILKYSAMPGTSRHHWGTDIDLNSFQNHYFESGEGKIIYNWLETNAASFGFCQPYTPHNGNRSGGYEEEKWHWSYLPIANNYLKAYKNQVDHDDIKGFDGDEVAKHINVIDNYVMEIDKACKP